MDETISRLLQAAEARLALAQSWPPVKTGRYWQVGRGKVWRTGRLSRLLTFLGSNFVLLGCETSTGRRVLSSGLLPDKSWRMLVLHVSHEALPSQ